MAYNPEEQEKIEGLKAWWSAHGSSVIIILSTMIAVMAGMQAWKYYHKQQAQQAADLFAVLQQQIDKGGSSEKINDALHLLTTGFSESGYASRAALMAAQANKNLGNLSEAKAKLQWILDHAKESEIKDIAKLRLAGILLDEKKFDEALRLLNSQHSESFSGLYADLKGDIYVAAGKPNEASAAYQKAYDRFSMSKSNYMNLVQMKLDAVKVSK